MSRGVLSDRYGLNRQQELVVLAVMAQPVVTLEQFVELLWPDADKQPDGWRNTIAVVMHRANTKIAPFGWRVCTRGWGWGWCLETTRSVGGAKT